MDITKTMRQVLMCAVLVGFSSMAHAVATLSFGGTIDYTSSSGLLTVDGALTGTQSIIPAPDLASSYVQLSTTYLNTINSNGVTVGSFGGGTITVGDISGALLIGSFSAAQMGGLDGGNQGSLTLTFSPTGGSLMTYFSNPSDLFALTLNLSSNFGATMFGSDFSGVGNGNITSRTAVPEPGVLSLLIVGVGLLGVSGWQRRRVAAARG